MIKQTISYQNESGAMVVEDAYFNLSLRELRKMQQEGVLDSLNALSELGNSILEYRNRNDEVPEAIATEFSNRTTNMIDELVMRSYGTKVEKDGHEKFVKNNDDTDAFMDSPAYDALFMDWMNDPSKFQSFLTNLVPKNIQAQHAQPVTVPAQQPVPMQLQNGVPTQWNNSVPNHM